jgi:hypothetical protein
MADELTHWRYCSSCKKAIDFNQKYFECSVSTCVGKRTGYVFCSLFCWERHLPGAKHRDAGAVEKISPNKEDWKRELAGDASLAQLNVPLSGGNTTQPQQGQRRIVNSVSQTKNVPTASNIHAEILVVVSKMKSYVKEVADMNTSGDVADILSDIIREACDKAINSARADGRKTVMARDFEEK